MLSAFCVVAAGMVAVPALAVTLAQIDDESGAEPSPIRFVLLPSGAPLPEREKMLADPALREFSQSPDASYFVPCVTAWGILKSEAAACIRSRLPDPSVIRLVVVRPAPNSIFEVVGIDCIGPARTGEALIGSKLLEHNAPALASCITAASGGTPPPALRQYGLGSAKLGPAAERAAAAEAAPSVLGVAVDHVGIPRGVHGPCHIAGRIISVRRGAALSQRGLFELILPCSEHGADHEETGTVAMSELVAGTFADLYLNADQRVIGFRRTSIRVERHR